LVIYKLSASAKNIYQTTEWAPQILSWVELILENPKLIFEDSAHPLTNVEFNGKPILKTYESRRDTILMEDLSETFATALAVTMEACASHFKHHFVDFLDNGKYQEERYANILSSTPSTNLLCESVFGFKDYLHATRPNMGEMQRETIATLVKNKTMGYLKSLPAERQHELVAECRNKSHEFVQLFKEKLDKIKQEKMEKLQLEREERIRKGEHETETIELDIRTMLDYA
jgi:hypothetical protein